MLRRSTLCLLIVLVSFACGGSPTSPSDPSNPSGPSGSSGNLSVRITDSPFGRAQAVLVTFSEVALLLEGRSWTRVPFPDGASTRTCDLKKLENNAEDLLGTGALPLSEYTAVRVTVQSVQVFADSPASSPTPCARSIPAPSGRAPSTTLMSREGRTDATFRVGGSSTTLLIDFDGEASVTQDGTGAYFVTPVISFLSQR